MPSINCSQCAATNLGNATYCSRCGYALPKPDIEAAVPEVSQKQPVITTKRSLKSIVGMVLGSVLGYYLVQYFFFAAPSFDKVMMTAASELNKSCPIMVDEATRLDNAIALPENTFQYNYTLVNTDRTQINSELLRKALEPGIINNVRTNPDMKEFRENKTTIAYAYKDMNGIFILKILVTAEMYEKAGVVEEEKATHL